MSLGLMCQSTDQPNRCAFRGGPPPPTAGSAARQVTDTPTAAHSLVLVYKMARLVDCKVALGKAKASLARVAARVMAAKALAMATREKAREMPGGLADARQLLKQSARVILMLTESPATSRRAPTYLCIALDSQISNQGYFWIE